MTRLSDKERSALLEEWYGKGGKLERSGFEDVEAYRPHKHGDKQPLLGKGARFVSFTALTDGDEEQLDAESPVFDFYAGNTYLKFQVLEGIALAGILTRQDWEAVTAVALFSEGVSERRVAEIIGRSRGKTRDLLHSLKKSVATLEKIRILGGGEEATP